MKAGEAMNEGKRILIIDDEADHAELVAILLRRKGYVVDVAADGRTGLAAAQRDRPDLVLLDFFMPIFDGITTAEHLRADERTQAVPIVLVTACGEDLVRWSTYLQGRFGRLAKPFRAADLFWAVEDALGAPAAEVVVHS